MVSFHVRRWGLPQWQKERNSVTPMGTYGQHVLTWRAKVQIVKQKKGTQCPAGPGIATERVIRIIELTQWKIYLQVSARAGINTETLWNTGIGKSWRQKKTQHWNAIEIWWGGWKVTETANKSQSKIRLELFWYITEGLIKNAGFCWCNSVQQLQHVFVATFSTFSTCCLVVRTCLTSHGTSWTAQHRRPGLIWSPDAQCHPPVGSNLEPWNFINQWPHNYTATILVYTVLRLGAGFTHSVSFRVLD